MNATKPSTAADSLTDRRGFIGSTITLAAALALSACGSDEPTSTGSAAASDGFPVTVNGAFGPTRITARPERVAAVGFLRDADVALALGVTPVAMAEASFLPKGYTPWVLEALGTAKTKRLDTTNGLPFEQIAAARPDLILATDDYTLDKDRTTLTRIAPTSAYTKTAGTDRAVTTAFARSAPTRTRSTSSSSCMRAVWRSTGRVRRVRATSSCGARSTARTLHRRTPSGDCLSQTRPGCPRSGASSRSSPAGARAIVVAEIQDERVGRPWETAGEVETTWLRGSGGGRTPSRLDQAVRTFPEPAGRGYYWMAGETRTVRAARRYLRHERGLARERYSLTGYWMTIGAERWMERYEQMSEQLDAIWARADVDGADPEDLMDDYDAALEDAGL